jgi:hypothetical protein
MKIHQYKEIQLLAAKHDGENWVPDTNRLITRFAISDEHLATALIDSTSCTGYPTTISNFLNEKIEQPTSVFINSDEQYLTGINKKQSNMLKAIQDLKTLFNDRFDSGERLDKGFKESAESKLNTILNSIRDDNSFDLELLLEAFQKDSASIYADVISNINALMRDTAKEDTYLIENKSEIEQASIIDQISDYYFSKETSDQINMFVSEIALHMDVSKKSQYTSETIGNRIHSLQSWFKIWGFYSEHTNFKRHNGLLTISSNRSGHAEFFGESNLGSRIVAMELSWGMASYRRNSELQFDNLALLVGFYYSPTQYLQLISGVSSELWVKTTIRHILADGYDHKLFDKHETIAIEVPSINDVEAASNASKIAEKMQTLVRNNSQSKAKKDDLISLLDELSEITKVVCDVRREQFLTIGQEIHKKVIDAEMSNINISVDNILERRPDIKEKVLTMMDSKNILLHKK